MFLEGVVERHEVEASQDDLLELEIGFAWLTSVLNISYHSFLPSRGR